MTVTQEPETNPIGFGRMQRKEDARFVRGQGNYIDDIVLPGMLHGANQVDRHDRRRGASEGQGCHHGGAPRDPRARLDTLPLR